MKNLTIARAAILFCGIFFLGSAHAQTFTGTNLPGASQNFSLPIGAGTTNLALSVAGSATTFSHLLLKAGMPPSDTDYDFIAASDGHANAINLELPELSVTNYVLRVRTPTNSLAHSFSVIVATNVSDLRTARPATKPLVFSSQGSLGSGVWNYFRVDIPTNVSGWRIILTSTNAGPDLYVQRDQVPTTSVWLKRSQGQTNDVIAFAPNELSPGAYFIGVYQTAGVGNYTIRTELISFNALAWDPGVSDLGTQVYTNQGTNGGDFYFKITTQNTALNSWRTALNVLAGEANIYLAKGAPPSTASNLFKSERLGSDGFVIASSSFAAGEDWYYMVHAEPGSQWTLISGEPFVTDLGAVSSGGSSGSGNVTVGAEGMRLFKTTVPVNTVGWRLWLNGSTNSILVKKGSAPIPGSSDLSQAGQMLVVPPYLVGGQLFFVGVAGVPGTLINLDSRQQSYSDIPFVTNANLNITGYGYSTFRVQVPSNQVAWQVSVVVSNGNPNIAVRRNLVPNESNNDAYSEVGGNVTDSILLVPPTLSDGTFYVTVYGASNYSCVLQSGNPEVTDINFVSTTTNTDTNRVGWRLFKVSDISQQLGALGWDLFLTNFSPGTRIAMRRNAAPGIWNYRNPTQGTLGSYDFLSTADFLQRPGHQADVWYVGVYNPTNPLGNFTLITRELTASPVTFDSGSATRVSVPAGKWQFFRVDAPANALGWDVRLTNVLAGSPQLVVRREALPISQVNIGFPSPVTLTNWPTGNQWAAASDWTGRNLSFDGSINESGRILTMGYGRPLETGTYYIGIINSATSTNDMSYTISSRGIGDGLAIPVQDLGYVQNVTNAALAPRDVTVYRVSIPSNTPSWRVRLAPTSGDVLLAVGKDHVSNITAPNAGSVTNVATAGKKMLKPGNEHFVQLPPAGGTNILAGTYYLVVASEGATSPSNSTQIGSGIASYVLESLGSMPEMDLGLLDATDLVYTGQLEGGDSAAFHFHNYPFPTTLGFELSLSDRVGNPLMVSRGDVDIADPGADGTGVPADFYGNEGGQGNFLEASPGIITVSGPFETETIMVKARSSVAGVYPDAAYKLRVRRLFADPLAFDAGVTQVTTQTNIYQYFRIDVPPGALGWDVRITNVTGNAKLIICHEALPLDLVTLGWNPGRDDFWPFGAMWNADSDWTGRSFSSDGATSEDGHILAMGMGRPLEPGTYYVGVKNLNSPSPISYTIVSRGIGDGLALPVVDVPFTGGAITNSSLTPREAAYYRVVVPTNAASWQAKLTQTAGEALLVTLSNSLPSVLSGQSGALGKLMQKAGNEHYVLLPANGQPFLKPGTNFFAVVSEGIVATNTPTRIGSGSSSYVLESRGELKPVDLGTIDNSGVSATNALEGGEVRAYQFIVPAGTVSIEARLQNVTGNPAMVLRVGALFPNPGASSPVSGAGSVSADLYGNEGGQSIVATTGGANSSLITMANPSNTTYTIIVKARGSGASYANATYTLSVRALNYMTVDFDGGSGTVANQPANNWQYFRVDVPPNALGWDVRITNVTSGAPRLVVRRDLLPNSLTTTPWGLPGNTTNWPSTNQWAAGADWTRRTMTSDNLTNEDGRILAMGMCQPLEPGTYYVGVINSSGTNSMSYTLVSRGIGDGLSIPVADLPYTGNVTNLDLPPREAAYYRVAVPANSPGWKLKLAPTSGEAMVLVLKDHIPNVDTGRQPSATSGKFMQKAGNEHYIILPSTGQSNIAPAVYYIAVVGEGLNPGSATQIGTASSDFVLTSFGDAPVANLGTASLTGTIVTNSLEGGESRLYQFAVSQTAQAIEVRLENRVGNPVLVLSSNTFPDPGGVLTGPKDTYGNDGGVVPMDVNSNIITIPNPTPGKYTIAIKARASGTAYPDASYVLRVRELPIVELNFTAEFNTNGLSNADSRLLLDNQRAFYKVVVPTNVWNQPVIGWQLDLSQLSGNAGVRVRKDFLPSDSVAGVPFTPNAAIIAPPFLNNGTWYVEVRGTNSTSYTLISSSLKLQRSAWVIPQAGETNSAPGVSAPFFADTGVDTNGLPLPGDQGIDLQQGRYHYYAVVVPTNNAGLLRVQLDAISANSDLYMRLNQVPTYTHRTNGIAGTTLDRSVTSGTITEYANWVPLNGKSETVLTAGTWYLAVRAVTNANARYRLRLSAGNSQDLALDGGSLTNQIVAGGDWTYYRVQIPSQPPPNWQVTFSQQAGDVVMHVRDTVPPGNGATTAAVDYKDWASDQKNNGPYASYDSPGAYTFTVPPIRPGATYYLGFRGKSDSTFSVSSSVSGATNLPLPIIEFYGGSVTNSLPAGGMVAYRILTPSDALRWRSISTHSNSVQVFIENGTLPTQTSADDFHSTIANSTIDHFLTNYPWLPNQTFYLVATNTSATPQTFNFNMNGSSGLADDDADGLPDAWEIQYFGTLAFAPGVDSDQDGVSNMSEYLEGTNPANKNSFRPRLTILSTNGVIAVDPVASNYTMGASVTLTATPSLGYNFVDWRGTSLSGSQNPLIISMTTNITVIPRFRVPADDFDQRIALAGFFGTSAGLQNAGATKESGEPNHAGNPGGKSLWWTWTAPSSGVVTFNTGGTDFRNALAVYAGQTVSNLTAVATNLAGVGNNTNQVAFNATAGSIYQISVDGFNGATGQVVLSFSLPNAFLLSTPSRQPDGSFQFTLNSAPGQVLNIEASTNLVDWIMLYTGTNATGTIQFNDPAAINFARRFYRAVAP